MDLSKIKLLDKEKWQDFTLTFDYIAHNYYEVEIKRTGDDFLVSFVKKSLSTPLEKNDENIDKLFKPCWDDVKAWGIIEDEKLIAVIETSVESWSNRLRVTEIWIDKAYHRMRIGTALMDIAVKRAKDEGRRAIILETQSCNEVAINFYLSYGFTLIGFDSCCYQNDDVGRNEVRMEFGLFL